MHEEAMPVNARVVNLYNLSSGYITFLISMVFVIISQATVLTAVDILGGTMRKGNKLRRIYPNSNGFWGALPIMMGKATAYLGLSTVTLLIILGIIMPPLGIPMRSTMLTTMVFMTSFILSIAFMGLCLLNFLHRKEDAIVLIMYTSLSAMVLIGFSWPSVAMSERLNVTSYIVPTTLGAKGFISIIQMGTSLPTIMPYWSGMRRLCLLYLSLVTLILRKVLR